MFILRDLICLYFTFIFLLRGFIYILLLLVPSSPDLHVQYHISLSFSSLHCFDFHHSFHSLTIFSSFLLKPSLSFLFLSDLVLLFKPKFLKPPRLISLHRHYATPSTAVTSHSTATVTASFISYIGTIAHHIVNRVPYTGTVALYASIVALYVVTVALYVVTVTFYAGTVALAS